MEKENIMLSKFEDNEVAIPEIDMIIVCVSCEDKVACETDMHAHILSVHRKQRYNVQIISNRV